MKQLFATSKNGVSVYLDRDASHALTHFAHEPNLAKAVRKVIESLNLQEDIVRIDRDMGEIVGKTDLVETADGDEIVYAKRPLRDTYSRFVKNKQSVPTSWVTIDLRRDGDGYALRTAFVGRLTPSFPGGDYLPEQSKEFWSKHALVWGSQEIVSGTETTDCPW